jgi:hypothetical protein
MKIYFQPSPVENELLRFIICSQNQKLSKFILCMITLLLYLVLDTNNINKICIFVKDYHNTEFFDLTLKSLVLLSVQNMAVMPVAEKI